MINCSICQTQFESIRKLSHHICVHKITLPEYYDSYINGYWMHNSHAYNSHNKSDKKTLDTWIEKAKTSKQYQYAIYVWTKSDPEKRKYGQSLNFVELWNTSDIEKYISNLKEVN